MSHGFSDYDRWKLRSPYDDKDQWDEDDLEPCDHDDYDVDLLEGRATCGRCGESWAMSNASIDRYLAMLAEYDRWDRQQRHPLTRLRQWIVDLWSRVRRPSVADDDEIPF